MDYSVNEEAIKTYKQRNDWLAILGLYGLQLLDRPIDTKKFTIDDISEILFAAGHHSDNLQKLAHNKVNAERTVRAYLWVYDNGKQACIDTQSIKILKSYAYSQYDLTANSYALNKMCKTYHVDDKIRKALARYIKNDTEQAVKCFKLILKNEPDDIKSWYRLGHTLLKEKEAQGYRMEHIEINNLYNEIQKCFHKVADLYKEKSNPKSCFKEYIHAIYGISKNISYEIAQGFDYRWAIKYIAHKQQIFVKGNHKTGVYTTMMRGINWTLNDVKEADDCIKLVKKELNLSEDPDNVELNAIIKSDLPIIPHYIYYRQAKIYLIMALCYNSNIGKIYERRKKDEKFIWKKYDNYWRLALKNAELALKIHETRKEQKIKDSNNKIVHEVHLLAVIYCLALEYSPDKLEALGKKYPMDIEVNFYYIIAQYFYNRNNLNPEDNFADVIKKLSKLHEAPNKTMIKKTIKYLEAGRL